MKLRLAIARLLSIAVPVVGGMVSSTLLTLIVIPAIYGLVKGHGLPRRTEATIRLADAEAPERKLAAE